MTVHDGPLVGGPNDGEHYQWDGPELLLMEQRPITAAEVETSPMAPAPRTIRYRWTGLCWKWVPE